MQEIDWSKITGDNNPVKDLRDQLAMSREALAKAAGVAYNTCNYSESGIAVKVSDKLHDLFSSRFSNYNKDKVNELYDVWIVNSRRKTTLPPVAINISTDPDSPHPFEQYLNINKLRITTFCVKIRIPKYPVYHYIKPGMQQTMPTNLATALMQCGMPDKQIRLLDALGRSHYSNVLRKRINERQGYDNNGTGKLAG